VKSEEVLFKLACGRVCSLLIPSYLLTFTSVSLQANSPLNPNLKPYYTLTPQHHEVYFHFINIISHAKSRHSLLL